MATFPRQFVLLLLAFVGILPLHAGVLRVDGNVIGGSGDGSSWANAYPLLQDALAAAAPGDEVWVARGVHYPDEGAGQTDNGVDSTFAIPAGVSILGGFDGSEVERSARDPDRNLTVLSGDLAQDDADPDGDSIVAVYSHQSGKNADTVVLILDGNRETLVDGFTITAGHAHSSLGGLYTFYGGAMVIENGNPVVSRCRFIGNRSKSGAGALWVYQSDPLILSCVFTGNHAERGGAMQLSAPTNACRVVNCLVAGNDSTVRGGGIYISSSGAPTITNCTIVGNRSVEGGGVYNNAGTASVFQNTIIWGNEAEGVTSTVTASVFTNSATPTFSHCIVQNSTGEIGPGGEMGGDLGGNQDLDPELGRLPAPGSTTGYLFLRPHAGSPAFDGGDSALLPADITDVDRDGDTAEPLPVDLASADRVFGASVDVGAFEAEAVIEILTTPAPYVADWQLEPETDPDVFDLSTIFAGDVASFELSFNSSPTIIEASVDPVTGLVSITPQRGEFGRVELVVSAVSATGGKIYIVLLAAVFPPIVYVDSHVVTEGNGSSWSRAIRHLGDALALGGDIREIWIADGVYRPDRGGGRMAADPDLAFEVRHGIRIYGGFEGTETTREQRDPSRFLTILSGDVDRNDRNDDGNHIAESSEDIAGTNSRTVVRIAGDSAAVLLDGLVITAGADPDGAGGGLSVEGDSIPQIMDCQFSGNTARYGGGFSVNDEAAPTFHDCRFEGNSALQGGAGHSLSKGHVTLRSSTLRHNSAQLGGGVFGGPESALLLEGCVCVENHGSGGGGAVRGDQATIVVRESTFSGNSGRSGGALSFGDCSTLVRESEFFRNVAANNAGGGIDSLEGALDVRSCRFGENRASSGGGIYVREATARVVNTLFAGNLASTGGGIYSRQCVIDISNCVAAGNTAANGGALYNFEAVCTVVNSVFSGNSAIQYGGAINESNTRSGTRGLTVRNSIFWENKQDGEVNSPASTMWTNTNNPRTPVWSHNLISGSPSTNWSAALGTDLGNNIDTDPRFLVPVEFSGSRLLPFNLRPAPGSPALNKGLAADLPSDDLDLDDDGDTAEPLPVDFDGNPRIQQSIVDLGAYELVPGPTIVPVPPEIDLSPGSGAHPGVLDLSQVFGVTAERFGVLAAEPDDIVTVTVDPVTGRLDIEVHEHHLGRTIVTVSGTDMSGRTSLAAVTVDVFPPVIFVDKGATGRQTGLSWEDAFKNLQDALSVTPGAEPGLELWVAGGAYTPDEGIGFSPGEHNASFRLPPEVALYGGFAGSESQREERNPARNLTILSGDVGRDDLNADGNAIAESLSDVVGRNSGTIINLSGATADAVLDGIVITAGEVGVECDQSHLLFKGCLVTGAEFGGVRVTGGAPRFEDCRFVGNSGNGGGAVRTFESAVQFANCRFERNASTEPFSNVRAGGALACDHGSEVELTACSFTGNTSLTFGGAIDISSTAKLTARDCIFDENRGGTIAVSGGTLFLSGCTFRSNISGAISTIAFQSDITAVNCRFIGNAGRAVSLSEASRSSTATITNCLFSGNSGGGIYHDGAGLALTNCVLTGHTGPALSLGPSASSTTVANCILWNNLAGESTESPDASIFGTYQPLISHSIIANSGGSANWNPDLGVDGGGNLDVDPGFLDPVDPRFAPTTAGDLRLSAGSPATDAGDSNSLPADLTDLDQDRNLAEPIPHDLAGMPRLAGPKVDIGVFERQGGPGLSTPVDPIRLAPNSGSHPDILELSEVFDGSAVQYSLTAIGPEGIVTPEVDAVTGLLDLTVQPDRLGVSHLVVSARDAAGQQSFYRLVINVLPAVVYVDASATGTGSGTSWTNAIPTLQEALKLGGSGYEIWVSRGIYYPNEASVTPRNELDPAFRLQPGVSLYGGFAGHETERSQRDPNRNPTILSGDLDQDDENGDGNSVAESFHDLRGTNASSVLIAAGVGSETTIAGFIVTAGNGEGGGYDGFRRSGGGLYSVGECPSVSGCTFTGNRALYRGGAITLKECSSASIRNCLFSGNTGQAGGAVAIESTQAIISDCSFVGNEGTSGGALWVGGFGGSECAVVNCRFAGNLAVEDGGAASIHPSSAGTLANCVLSGNKAESGGGLAGSPALHVVNSVLTGNRAIEGGGAVTGSVRFNNTILWNNEAYGSTTAITSTASGYPLYANCIVANSGGSADWTTNRGTDGGGNLDADPLFFVPTDPTRAPTLFGDVRLRAGSPAYDTGDLSALPLDVSDVDEDGDLAEALPLDLAGRPRQLGPNVDMGAYEGTADGPAVLRTVEPIRLSPNTGQHPSLLDAGSLFDQSAQRFSVETVIPSSVLQATIDPATGSLDVEVRQDEFGVVSIAIAATDAAGATSFVVVSVEVFPEVVYVASSARGTASGLSWEDAFPTLQHALTKGGSGYEIWVAAGEYSPFEGPGVGIVDDPYTTFRLLDGVGVYGGFAGNEGFRSDRNHHANPTTLTGGQYVVSATDVGDTSILDGFVVTNPSSTAMRILRSSPAILNISFAGHGSRSALIIDDSAPSITHCTIEGWSSHAIDVRSNSSPTFHGCVIHGNRGTGASALVNGQESTTTLVNCTITGNRAGTSGGAILNQGDSNLMIRNSIIWNNMRHTFSDEIASSIRNVGTATATFSHCIVANSGGSAAWDPATGIDLGGNLDDDPMFLQETDPLGSLSNSPLGFPYLDEGSPAIDAGSNGLAATATDATNRPRIAGGTVDLGAFEAHGDELDTDDDGLSDEFERSYTNPPSPTALDPLDDLDFDGRPNLMEFAMGSNPLHPDNEDAFTILLVPDESDPVFESRFAVSYRRSVWSTKYLDLQVESSFELAPAPEWTAGFYSLRSDLALGPLHRHITEQTSFLATARYRFQVTPQAFFRLVVTRK